jgi:hypothetical protein
MLLLEIAGNLLAGKEEVHGSGAPKSMELCRYERTYTLKKVGSLQNFLVYSGKKSKSQLRT